MNNKNIVYLIEKPTGNWPYRLYATHGATFGEIDNSLTFNNLIEVSEFFNKYNLYEKNDINVVRAQSFLKKI